MNLYRFAKIHNDEQVNTTETEREDTEPKVIQPTENMAIVCNERPTLSMANEALNKKELYRQTQNQDNIIITRSGWTSRKHDKLCYY